MNFDSANFLMLVIGDIRIWKSAGRTLPEIENTHFCGFDDLNLEFLTQLNPDLILSSLMSSEFDLMDLVKRLDELDFVGRVRILTTPLPDVEIILSEVRFEHPCIDIDLIEMPPKSKLRGI